MPYQNFEDNLQRISNKILEYGEYKKEYYKLLLYKIIIKITRSLLSFILFGVVLLLIFFFISLGLAQLIGEALGSIAYGYLIMGGFYMIILVFLIIFGKKILEKKILQITSGWFSD